MDPVHAKCRRQILLSPAAVLTALVTLDDESRWVGGPLAEG